MINAGHLRELDKLDRAARRVVEKCGFQTAYGWFVPYRNFREMKQEFDVLKAQYFALRDEILERYEELKRDAREAYAAAAREAYRLLQRDFAAEAPEDFVARFVEAASAALPSPERVRDSFYMEMDVAFVPLTSFLAAEEAQRRLIKQREELLERELRLLEQELAAKERLQAEEEALQKQILRERCEAELLKARRERELMEEAHREAIEAFRRQIDEFLGDVVGRVYGIVYEAVLAVRERLARRGELRAADGRRLISVAERAQALNFTDDARVEEPTSENCATWQPTWKAGTRLKCNRS
ncbi:DUF3150 domain-containing protein [Thermodesulfitimonas sp.]